MSSELARDGAPLRLMLLGEKLIAFRDSAGRVGVMDHRCPHRCASLFLGRNEEGGIRCIYHGWKFDVAGNCLDMPSLPPPGFKQKVKAKAYKVVERAGVVWVYMGSRAEAPPLPAFEILDVPEDEIKVSFIQRDCNYLQALEGEIDTSHFGFLHAGHVDPEDLAENEPVRNTVINRAPEYHLAETPWGTQYAGYREAGPGQTYWRFGNFLFPFWTQAPNGEFGSHMHARAWVPLDDEHTMFCFIWWKRGVSAMSLPQPAFKDGTPIGGTGRGNKLLPNTTDWLGRWRMAANPGNDWGIDRAAQQSNSIYSGIDGIHLQDQAITESMGPDRRPHLGASGAFGSDDHPHAPAPADGGARAARQGRLAARRRGRRGLSRSAQRLLRQRRQEPLAGGLCQAAGRFSPSAAVPHARCGVGGHQLTRGRFACTWP